MDEQSVIKELEDITNMYDKSSVSVFFVARNRINAGKYSASIVIRTIPDREKSAALTKKLMELFINGKEIHFERSYMSFVEEKALRVEDFELSCEFDIE